MSAPGAKVGRGELADLDVLKAAAAESDGVIHLGYRADLIRSGGLAALRDSALATVLAWREGLAGTNKPLGPGGQQRRALEPGPRGPPWRAGQPGTAGDGG